MGIEKLHWYDTDLALSCFSGNVAGAKAAYLEFLGADEDADETQLFEGGGKIRSLGFQTARSGEAQLFDERILGDSDFVRSLITPMPGPIDVSQAYFDENHQ